MALATFSPTCILPGQARHSKYYIQDNLTTFVVCTASSYCQQISDRPDTGRGPAVQSSPMYVHLPAMHHSLLTYV